MPGKEHGSWKLFSEAVKALEAAGLVPVGPAYTSSSHDESQEKLLAASLLMLMDCDILMMLPGWRLSAESRLEYELATLRGIPVISPDDSGVREPSVQDLVALVRKRFGSEKDFIDLGLPSGRRWATENESGFHTFGGALQRFGDALPTKEDFEELMYQCSWKWLEKKHGFRVTGPNGKSIFLPVTGGRDGADIYDPQQDGYYWSCTPYDDSGAHYLYFNKDEVVVDNIDCLSCGFFVRLVKG